MADDQKNVESGVHRKKDVAQESHPIQNIVLFGKTGNGKSATGNSIAKQMVFVSKSHAAGVTMECQKFRVVTPEGPILNVIDTPGLYDLSVQGEVISREIVRCLTIAEGGIHAAILVLSLMNRFTQEEEKVLSTLQILFGPKIVDYLIIIFTAGDVLEEDDVTLDEYLKNCPEFLKRILILCGQRKIVFDNKTKDDEKKTKQVHELINLIDLVKEKNNNKPYTNEIYHKIKEEVHKKEDVSPPAKADDKKEAESHQIQNIVLFGRTGNGKSATGNSIARQNVFVSRLSSSGVTMECRSMRFVTPEGPILNVIDTPGLFDMSVEADVKSREIVRCLTLAEGGIHAAIFVLSLKNRFSEEEKMVLSTLLILFGPKIVDYLIIIFTAGDVLEEDDVTLKDYLKDCPDFLKRVLKLCGQRMTLFDNKTKDDAKKTQQVHELLRLIDMVRMKNGNKPYTNEMYHKIKEENDRHKKEQEELEAKGHSDEQLEALKKELELTREEHLKAMTDMMEKNIKKATEEQEKLFELKEKSQRQDDGCTIL